MLKPERLLPLRHRFMRATRAWFDTRGFCEVETPTCVRSPGMEPHLTAFEVSTRHTPLDYRRLYLHTSPEYHMKRALARHRAPLYQVCRCYRDETPSRLHHPEFTMLEWYRPDADYTALMDDCEALLSGLAQSVLDAQPLELTTGRVALDGPFERLSVSDAFVRYAQLDPFAHDTADELRDAARSVGLDIPPHWTWEDGFHFVLLESVEPHLGRQRPTLLIDYPPRLAALSRVVDGVAERFELYIDGHELANAFSELVDPVEQRRRFEAEQQSRAELGRPVYPIDERLLEALEALPPSAGIALGLDRLWLLFAEHELGQRVGLTEALWLDL